MASTRTYYVSELNPTYPVDYLRVQESPPTDPEAEGCTYTVRARARQEAYDIIATRLNLKYEGCLARIAARIATL